MSKSIIGHTPLTFSAVLSDMVGCNVYIKEEYKNPGQSSKDRIALYMIERAEQRGDLKPGYTVVEASSGNTAIGLAMVCREKNYPCVLFLSKSASIEKLNLLRQLDAEIHFSETSGGPADPRSSQAMAATYTRLRGNAYYCNQYFNNDNKEAHYLTTGPEIWDQSGGKITHFISGVGTGGTISGVGEFLKQKSQNIHVIGVDPVGSILTPYFNRVPLEFIQQKPYIIEGIGRSFIPGSLNFKTIDQFVQVETIESALTAYHYSNMCGFKVGFSSGAVMAALFKIKHTLQAKDKVVLLFADSGDRYLSKLYNADWMKTHVSPDLDWPIAISGSFRRETANYGIG